MSRELVAVLARRRWGLVVVILLLGCRQPSRPVSPPVEGWRTVRYLVDDLAAARGLREGSIATIDHVSRYVLTELPTQTLAPASSRVTATSDEAVEMTLSCPPPIAGRRVALSVTGIPILPRPQAPLALQDAVRDLETVSLAVPPSLSCPIDATQPVVVPLRGLRPGMSAVPTVMATDEPAMRVETPWLTAREDAILRLAVGLADPSSSATFAPARFRIRAENRSGQSSSLLDRVLDPAQRPAERGWIEEKIPMARVVAALGAELRLVFDTTPAGDRRPVFPVWGDPAILVPTPPPAPERRNVVLVSVDTLRADRLGVYGAFPTNSPGLDRLAADGTIFTRAFASAPWTLPSHTTMLTGVLGCVHGRGTRFQSLPAGISPLAEILRRNGYSTAAFTEDVYLNAADFGRGFGVFDAYMTPGVWAALGEVARTAGNARAWLERHAAEPFFLFLHTYQVHAPYQAPPPYGDLLEGRLENALSRPPEVQAAQDLARYDEEVRYTDSVLDSLLGSLDTLGLTGRTIVVVTSDHGEAFGEHGRFGHVILDEAVIRVPLIWRAPGLVAAGRLSPVVASLTDIVPTMLDLLGLPVPALVGGQSLARFLRDVDPPAAAANRVVLTEHMLGNPYPIVVRGGNWRATFAGMGAPELRLVANGRERELPSTSPVAQEAIAARARYDADCRRLARLASQAVPAAPPPPPSPDELRALRALGYVQ